MKKNDFATFLVYIGMFAIALVVGLTVIKPIIDSDYALLPLHPAIIMVLGLLAGVFLNAIMLEGGHLLGAKSGKYRVLRSTVLGFSIKDVDGKKKFAFSGFDGLVGETKIAPRDVKESTLTGFIFFPILFLFLEFIGCMVGIVVCQNAGATLSWLRVFLITILTVGGMIYFYDLFPANIESRTDGYLFVLLSKPANKEAYNNLLLAEAAAYEGKPIPETPIYTEITDFTAYLNSLTVYRLLVDGKPQEALPILEPVFAEGSASSAMVKLQSKTLKLATLLEQDDKTKGKKLYEELSDEEKKYIANLSSLTALRAYLLIASFIEGSESEANYAIDKAEKAIKACEPNIKEAEKSLLQLDVDITRSAHPSWDVYRLPWEEKEEPKE